ncbi:MAG: glycosyltransferase family 2 protein [Candidatus Bathyarchaeia archaeon]
MPILLTGVRCRGDKNVSNPLLLPKFSIIVPAKDEEAVIERCIKALLETDYPSEKIEIIIVEGGSRDLTGKICDRLQKCYPNIIKVIHEYSPRGKPSALNLALSYATGEIIGVFDADSVPEKDVLKKVALYFQDPRITAVQGRPLPLNERQNMLTKIAAKEERAWFQALLKGRDVLGLFVPLTGSCQFIKRSTLDEVGGWDAGSLAEDVEMALTLTEKGYIIKYADDVRFWQEIPDNLRDMKTQRVRWYRGCMEAAFKYARLLKKPSKKTIDAEISLVGPFIMVLCLIIYLTWLALIIRSSNQLTNLLLNPAAISTLLTIFSLFSLGLALIFSDKPINIENILWLPFIYAYWFLQLSIAGQALIEILLHKPKVWRKTAKHGYRDKRVFSGNG